MATQVIDTRRADILAGQVQSAPVRGLGELFAQLNGWLEHRRNYRATVKELSALNDHLLADIGVKRSEIAAHAARLARRSARPW
jgi:uncharacterized protein YjiS (DUF1127 family)